VAQACGLTSKAFFFSFICLIWVASSNVLPFLLLLGFPHLSIFSTHPPLNYFFYILFLTIIEIGSYLYQLSKHDPSSLPNTLRFIIQFLYFADTTERRDRVWQEAQRQGEERVTLLLYNQYIYIYKRTNLHGPEYGVWTLTWKYQFFIIILRTWGSLSLK
jgi:hypothetical protein